MRPDVVEALRSVIRDALRNDSREPVERPALAGGEPEADEIREATCLAVFDLAMEGDDGEPEADFQKVVGKAAGILLGLSKRPVGNAPPSVRIYANGRADALQDFVRVMEEIAGGIVSAPPTLH